jgi:ADP-ribose pyrophosphatase
MSVVFKGKWFEVIQEPITLPDSRVILMEWVCRRDGVRIIARREDGAVLITDEYRSELGRRDFRLPGGKVDDSDTPIEAAKKELQEETGFRATDWNQFGSSQAFATVRYSLHFFEARGLVLDPVDHDEGEDVRVCWFPVEEVVQMALDGRIGEDLSALQLLRLLLRGGSQ